MPLFALLLAAAAVVLVVTSEKKPQAPAVPPGTPSPPVPPPPVTPPGQTVPAAPGVPEAPTTPGPTSFLGAFGAGTTYQLSIASGLAQLIIPGLAASQSLLVCVAPGADVQTAIMNPIFAGAVQGVTSLGNTAAWYASVKAQGHQIFYQVDPSGKFAIPILDQALPGFLTA